MSADAYGSSAGDVRATQQLITMRSGVCATGPIVTAGCGMPPGEGVFLPCSFWLADNRVPLNRREEAQDLFERLLALSNDVGLLSVEYDPRAARLLGNFPQSFSHIALVNTAHNLTHDRGPARQRASGKPRGRGGLHAQGEHPARRTRFRR